MWLSIVFLGEDKDAGTLRDCTDCWNVIFIRLIFSVDRLNCGFLRMAS